MDKLTFEQWYNLLKDEVEDFDESRAVLTKDEIVEDVIKKIKNLTYENNISVLRLLVETLVFEFEPLLNLQEARLRNEFTLRGK